MDLPLLFHHHLAERLRWDEQALNATGFDQLVISSGLPHTYFADDQQAPFRAVPHFRHHCPLPGPHHLLKLEAGKQPELICHSPEDFWYEPLPLGNPFWAAPFKITEVSTPDKAWEYLGHPHHAAYIGPELERAATAGMTPNPSALVLRLDWSRAYKSDYEIRSMEEATALGAKGHSASRMAFLAGASELEIHQAYVQATESLDEELAFPSIVALDEKGATLHYEHKRRTGSGRCLLMDCGSRVRDYPSDITRTTLTPFCHPVFASLAARMERLQQELCAEVKPGLPFGALHHQAHMKLGALLQECGILRTEPAVSLQRGFTRPFLPHGLGHYLGIQVHDVGGKLASPEGAFQAPPPEHPYLRTTRILEERQIITIEPGLYFIPMLLKPFREGPEAACFDWDLIDALSPFGGIRIEDNLLVVQEGGRNLTREHLPS